MTAYDGELRLKGVSDLMKIQVRVGPSRIAGQASSQPRIFTGYADHAVHWGEDFKPRTRSAFSRWQCLHLSFHVPLRD